MRTRCPLGGNYIVADYAVNEIENATIFRKFLVTKSIFQELI
ncbi:hypothetical protein ALT1545_10278 [Alteromonas macleodii]